MLSKQKVLKNFILRDHRGRDWHVRTRPIGGKLYFNDGWKRFREENCLEENGFLVFTHIENNVFKFKILELSSMCEMMKIVDEEEINNNTMNVKAEEEEEDEDDDGDDADDDDYTMVEDDDDEQEEDEDVDDDDYDDEEEEDDDDDDDVCIIVKEKKNEGVGKGTSRSCEHEHCRTCKACMV
jgi:hypothetical protein